MDFRLRKLYLGLGIVIFGMVAALLWHAFEGWGLGKDYPNNTFLSRPEARYLDFTEGLQALMIPNARMNYFPASYIIFRPFLFLRPMWASILFLDGCVIGLFIVLHAALKPLLPHPGWRMLATVLFLWSYPVIYGLDRGNIEILLGLLTGASLLFYSRKKFAGSFFFLLPAICFKVYPAVLLLLFFRRKLIHWIFIGVVAFVVISLGFMLILPGTLMENFTSFSDKMAAYNQFYIVGQRGIGNSASAWNLFRICVWLGYSFSHGNYAWPMPDDVVTLALGVYYKIFLGVVTLVSLYCLLVETTFARRAVLLLLYLTVSAPGGGEYKLIFIDIALVILILMTERRPFDLVITAALALCLIPKREVMLDFLGTSDTGAYDASVNVIVNPICMLLAMALLMVGGWRATKPSLKRRFYKIAAILRLTRFTGLYRASPRRKSKPVKLHKRRR